MDDDGHHHHHHIPNGYTLDVAYPTGHRPRRRTSAHQKKILDKQFERNPRPDRATKLRIAEYIQMEYNLVQVWFQNRRAKEKRKEKDAAEANPSSASSSRSPLERDADDAFLDEVNEARLAGVVDVDERTTPTPPSPHYHIPFPSRITPPSSSRLDTRRPSLPSTVLLNAARPANLPFHEPLLPPNLRRHATSGADASQQAMFGRHKSLPGSKSRIHPYSSASRRGSLLVPTNSSHHLSTESFESQLDESHEAFITTASSTSPAPSTPISAGDNGFMPHPLAHHSRIRPQPRLSVGDLRTGPGVFVPHHSSTSSTSSSASSIFPPDPWAIPHSRSYDPVSSGPLPADNYTFGSSYSHTPSDHKTPYGAVPHGWDYDSRRLSTATTTTMTTTTDVEDRDFTDLESPATYSSTSYFPPRVPSINAISGASASANIAAHPLPHGDVRPDISQGPAEVYPSGFDPDSRRQSCPATLVQNFADMGVAGGQVTSSPAMSELNNKTPTPPSLHRAVTDRMHHHKTQSVPMLSESTPGSTPPSGYSPPPPTTAPMAKYPSMPSPSAFVSPNTRHAAYTSLIGGRMDGNPHHTADNIESKSHRGVPSGGYIDATRSTAPLVSYERPPAFSQPPTSGEHSFHHSSYNVAARSHSPGEPSSGVPADPQLGTQESEHPSHYTSFQSHLHHHHHPNPQFDRRSSYSYSPEDTSGIPRSTPSTESLRSSSHESVVYSQPMQLTRSYSSGTFPSDISQYSHSVPAQGPSHQHITPPYEPHSEASYSQPVSSAHSHQPLYPPSTSYPTQAAYDSGAAHERTYGGQHSMTVAQHSHSHSPESSGQGMMMHSDAVMPTEGNHSYERIDSSMMHFAVPEPVAVNGPPSSSLIVPSSSNDYTYGGCSPGHESESALYMDESGVFDESGYMHHGHYDAYATPLTNDVFGHSGRPEHIPIESHLASAAMYHGSMSSTPSHG